jgi:hypothetical protein
MRAYLRDLAATGLLSLSPAGAVSRPALGNKGAKSTVLASNSSLAKKRKNEPASTALYSAVFSPSPHSLLLVSPNRANCARSPMPWSSPSISPPPHSLLLEPPAPSRRLPRGIRTGPRPSPPSREKVEETAMPTMLSPLPLGAAAWSRTSTGHHGSIR